MEQGKLIGDECGEVVAERARKLAAERLEASRQQPARIIEAQRKQVELRPTDLESLVPPDHRARALWGLLERLDLSRWYDRIKARGSRAGRPCSDPKVLLGLWIYATASGVSSARELARLSESHDVYRWLRGGVPLDYHTLSDFRVDHEAELDDLMTRVLGAMVHQKLLQLERVAQDGTRIRASAGSSSFRRKKRLKECLAMAREQVKQLKERGEAAEATKRSQAAQERAARERVERIEKALAAVEKVEAERAASKKGAKDPKTPARGSTSDPDARKMRMGNGGYGPGYSAQFASDTKSGVIVGVAVTQDRTDFACGAPMMEQIKERLGECPGELLVDTGFTSKKAVNELDAMGVKVYGALPVRKNKPDPYEERRGDSLAMRELKQRMRSEEGQAIYKERAPTAERVNGDLKRWRTLDEITVRGLVKVTSVVLLNALTFNLLRWISLAAQ